MKQRVTNLYELQARAVLQPNGCLLWQGRVNKNGYGCVDLQDGVWLAHRAAWLFAFGDPGAAWILHRCDTPACISTFGCLFRGTPQDNSTDMVEKLRTSHGEQHWCARLTAERVTEARLRYAQGHTLTSMAHEFGVHVMTLSDAVRRVTWRHVP